jgi:hypothetical protein
MLVRAILRGNRKCEMVLQQSHEDYAVISIFIMPGMFIYFGMIQGEFKVFQRQF